MLCIACGKEHKQPRNSFGKYCSNRCQKEYQYLEQVKNYLAGIEKGWTGQTRQLKPFLRRWLVETRGTACSICGWDNKHPTDGRVLTEVDHIDGNAENCAPENLRILCPNCHSMTPTFRARNKTSKRRRNSKHQGNTP